MNENSSLAFVGRQTGERTHATWERPPRRQLEHEEPLPAVLEAKAVAAAAAAAATRNESGSERIRQRSSRAAR